MATNSTSTQTHNMSTTGHPTSSNPHVDSQPEGKMPHVAKGAPIAIVGMSCRFAGEATSPSKLWDLCKSAGDAWTPIPHERFDSTGLYDKRKATRGHVRSFS